MSMARVVITAVVVEERSKGEVAGAYGVSRQWVRVLVKRYLTEGEVALRLVPVARKATRGERHSTSTTRSSGCARS
jgi:transposase